LARLHTPISLNPFGYKTMTIIKPSVGRQMFGRIFITGLDEELMSRWQELASKKPCRFMCINASIVLFNRTARSAGKMGAQKSKLRRGHQLPRNSARKLVHFRP
jgi:hypothetical protein